MKVGDCSGENDDGGGAGGSDVAFMVWMTMDCTAGDISTWTANQGKA